MDTFCAQLIYGLIRLTFLALAAAPGPSAAGPEPSLLQVRLLGLKH